MWSRGNTPPLQARAYTSLRLLFYCLRFRATGVNCPHKSVLWFPAGKITRYLSLSWCYFFLVFWKVIVSGAVFCQNRVYRLTPINKFCGVRLLWQVVWRNQNAAQHRLHTEGGWVSPFQKGDCNQKNDVHNPFSIATFGIVQQRNFINT